MKSIKLIALMVFAVLAFTAKASPVGKSEPTKVVKQAASFAADHFEIDMPALVVTSQDVCIPSTSVSVVFPAEDKKTVVELKQIHSSSVKRWRTNTDLFGISATERDPKAPPLNYHLRC